MQTPQCAPDHILVIDLEATCWAEGQAPTPDGQQTLEVMEIIEIGIALARLDGTVTESQSFLVRPVIHPILSDFCINLNGITQAMVDSAPVFRDAVPTLNAWLIEQGVTYWGSWGRGDLRLLVQDSQRHGIAPALLDLPYANLMKGWQKSQRHKGRAAMRTAYRVQGMELEGRHHSGEDDARNAARLLPFVNWDLAEKFVTDPANASTQNLQA